MLLLDERHIKFPTRPPDYVPEVPAGVPPQDAAAWAGGYIEVISNYLNSLFS
jgi:hypothetical protein